MLGITANIQLCFDTLQFALNTIFLQILVIVAYMLSAFLRGCIASFTFVTEYIGE